MSTSLSVHDPSAEASRPHPVALVVSGVPLDIARELRAELNRLFASDDHSYRAEFQSHEGEDGTLTIVQLGLPVTAAQDPLSLSGSDITSPTLLAQVVLGRLDVREVGRLERPSADSSPIWCDPA